MNRMCRFVLLGCYLSAFLGCGGSSAPSSTPHFYPLTIAETRAFINEQMAEKDIAGLSIALMDAENPSGSRLVWTQGFGLADKSSGREATAATLYCIGSSSKTITAVAVLRQKELGNLDLDRPLTDYITNFSLQSRYPAIGQNDRITPRTLLNMHAGVPGDIYNGVFILSMPWYETYINWLLGGLREDYPSHPPATIASYGNTGIVLAGHAAYLAGRSGTDTDFQAFVKRTVFDPLGMANTVSEVISKTLPDLATPYVQGEADTPFNSNGTATGGFYSTVNDMSRFVQMLLMDGMLENGQRYLEMGTVRELGKCQRTALDTGSYYQPGLGLDSVSLPAFYSVAPDQGDFGRAWAKNGSTGPFNAMIMLLPDAGLKLGVVVLSNSDTANKAVYTIARNCLLAAVREKHGLPRNPDPKPLPDFSGEAIVRNADIEGLYGTKSPSAYYKIEIRDDAPFWVTAPLQDATAGCSLTLKSDGSNAFAVEGMDWDVVFIDREDIDGNAYRLMVRCGGDDESLGPSVVTTLAEKMANPGALSTAWQARVGQVYLADQMLEISNDPYLTFDLNDGLLIVRTPSTQYVIHPQDDDLAFVGDTLSRGDGAVKVTHETANDRLFYLGSGYFPVELVQAYTLGAEDTFTLALRGAVPLSEWRKVTVAAGSSFEGRNVRFAATPGNERDLYLLYGEDFDLLGYGTGADGTAFQLAAGIYYLTLNPGIDSSGEKTLTSQIAE